MDERFPRAKLESCIYRFVNLVCCCICNKASTTKRVSGVITRHVRAYIWIILIIIAVDCESHCQWRDTKWIFMNAVNICTCDILRQCETHLRFWSKNERQCLTCYTICNIINILITFARYLAKYLANISYNLREKNDLPLLRNRSLTLELFLGRTLYVN